MFRDQGTQLKAMEQALFSVSDVKMKVNNSLGINLHIWIAKKSSRERESGKKDQNYKGNLGENWCKKLKSQDSSTVGLCLCKDS